MLNCLDSTTVWGNFPFQCWNLWLRMVRYLNAWHISRIQNLHDAFWENDKDSMMNTRKFHKSMYPRKWQSFDEMLPIQAGVLAQLKGKLGEKLQSSNYFVCPLLCLHLEITVSTEIHGSQVSIQANCSESFCMHEAKQSQAITHYVFSAHFQNGITERAVRAITEAARTMLLHAKATWPSAVHLCLWPHVVRTVV